MHVCVEVLRPSQPNGVMSSTVSLPNHVYWAGLVLYAVNQYCAHSFARNRQLPFLNQRKGENDRRIYFMINLHERMLPTLAGVEPATSWTPVGWRIQPTGDQEVVGSTPAEVGNILSCRLIMKLCKSTTEDTIFYLITAHTLISAQESNSIVIRLQPVYFFLKAKVVSTHLNCIDLSM